MARTGIVLNFVAIIFTVLAVYLLFPYVANSALGTFPEGEVVFGVVALGIAVVMVEVVDAPSPGTCPSIVVEGRLELVCYRSCSRFENLLVDQYGH